MQDKLSLNQKFYSIPNRLPVLLDSRVLLPCWLASDKGLLKVKQAPYVPTNSATKYLVREETSTL